VSWRTAERKTSVASPAAASAARFMDSSKASTCTAKPTRRSPLPICSSFSGMGMRIFGLRQ
jgi:hypothetical protein